MKDTFGNSFTKTLATGAVVTVTAILFITTAAAGPNLGGFAAYLPIIILVTSSASIASIWFFGRPRNLDSPTLKQLHQLELRIQELEQRIANAEIVNDFENRLAEKEIKSRHNQFDTPTNPSHTPTHPISQ
ncbi:ABC transporter C-terminal domain-containing protein [Rubritalea tangerina]|uniref:ABC transporter C-terminal domain-containing protein n=1 Tax=Rubritalea tangerina TaxID=430798 RepID=A0ABW4Z951_9BACT